MPPKKTFGKSAGTDPGLAKLKKDLSAGTLGNCYLFYGEEDFLRDHYLEQLRKKLIPKGMEDFNLHIFQGKDLEVQTLMDAVDAFPMMCERTLILVYDYDFYKSESRRDALTALFQEIPEHVCLVFVYDLLEYKSGGNTKLGKLVKSKAELVHFQPQSQSDLNAWIRRKFKQYGKEIGNPEAEYLTFLCGGLMTGLSSEIDKIAHYASGGGITKEDIDAVAEPVLDARVFQMTDAISAKEFRKSMELLSDLFLMNTEPIMILSVLGRQIRQLWSARLALENRMSQSDLALVWDMKSSWQSQRMMDSARRFDLRWCRQAVVLCAECDLAMKSTGLDSEELLTDLVLKLAHL